MTEIEKLEKIKINAESHRLLLQLMDENPELKKIILNSETVDDVTEPIKKWATDILKSHPVAMKYYRNGVNGNGRKDFDKLTWQDFAAIRILDYIDNAGEEYKDLNLHGDISVSNPFKLTWLAFHYGKGGAKSYFFHDMIHLFRQFSEKETRELPTQEKIQEWMDRHPSGLDPEIIRLREENRDRIISIIINKIDEGKIKSRKYHFKEGMSREQKYYQCLEWWNDKMFHLRFAVRNPDMLNEMLEYSIDPDTMKILYDARDQGIPFFINPYYLSLLNVRVPSSMVGSDLALRDYVIYSKYLVNEFSQIVAWEKEDVVKPGEPNAAGWLLPNEYNIHRRYPEVAILIPDTMGRACGGLCSSCQRMFDFQTGYLNFDLDKLKPRKKWKDKQEELLQYFENDSQLRDILITGGDALMASDQSLKDLLDGIYNMAVRKKEANKKRPEGKKHAEIIKVRLGTRLPVYLPMRIDNKFKKVLVDFKEKACKVGIKQFVIQTHFESAMEITLMAKKAINTLIEAGWMVTNQTVFIAASSRRGHTNKLRKVLNELGVLSYYTFSVKGYMENYHSFATNSRALQEQIEEKVAGKIPPHYHETIAKLPSNPKEIINQIAKIKEECNIPFLATDRNVLNLPGVGKSLTFRTIGITRYGRRILEFNHDPTRNHSPIIHKMGKVIIIESKAIRKYLEQLQEMGEDISEYQDLYGYSIGETEERMSLYEYPEYDFKVTKEMTNLEIPDIVE